jgi:hypothetical protein
MTPVLTKRQNYALWQSGAFGNKLRAWRSVGEWQASGFRGRVVLRELGRGGGRCLYNVEPDAVFDSLLVWAAGGVTLDQVMVNEVAPDQDVVLQGELYNGVLQDEEGFAIWDYFFYSTFRAQMRDALWHRPEHTYGLRADVLLRRAMTDASYEDWRILLDQYPDHVLEVSIYDRCLGDIPGRNALVWEVRRY